MKKVIFVAGPYRARNEWELEQHIRDAENAAIKLWQEGWVVICPHKNSAHFGGLCPDETWLEGDLELLRRSDAVYFLNTWRGSSGARNEHTLAELLHKQIIYQEELMETS